MTWQQVKAKQYPLAVSQYMDMVIAGKIPIPTQEVDKLQEAEDFLDSLQKINSVAKAIAANPVPPLEVGGTMTPVNQAVSEGQIETQVDPGSGTYWTYSLTGTKRPYMLIQVQSKGDTMLHCQLWGAAMPGLSKSHARSYGASFQIADSSEPYKLLVKGVTLVLSGALPGAVVNSLNNPTVDSGSHYAVIQVAVREDSGLTVMHFQLYAPTWEDRNTGYGVSAKLVTQTTANVNDTAFQILTYYYTKLAQSVKG